MIDFLKDRDSMGRDFKFNIAGRESFNTALGGILSLTTTLIFITLTWYYGKDMYIRKKPQFLIISDMKKEFPQRKLNNSIFGFGIRIEDVSGNPILDPSYYFYDFVYEYLVADSEGTWSSKSKIEQVLERCTTKHFDNYTLHHYKLYQYFCGNTNYTLGGNWGDNFIHSVSFFARRCNKDIEKSLKIKCKTNEELIKKYPNLFLDIYVQKNKLDPTKYESPIEQTFHYSFKGMEHFGRNAIKQRITYSTANLISDTGVIFSNYGNRSFIEYEDMEIDVSPWEKRRGEYKGIVQLYISRNHRTYKRVYDKISDALADVGGIMSFITIFIDLFFTIYLENQYSLFLRDTLIKINMEKKHDRNAKTPKELKEESSLSISKTIQFELAAHKKTSQVKSELNLSNSGLVELSPYFSPKKQGRVSISALRPPEDEKDIVLNKEIKKIIEYKNQDLVDIKISTSDIWKYNICCFSRNRHKFDKETQLKYDLLNATDREIEKKIEITDLLRMLDQFRLVKKIIMNESQCYMMKKRDKQRVIDTRIVSAEEEDKQEEERENQDKKNLVQYLINKKDEKKISSVDILLFKYLEPDFKTEIKEAVNIE